MWCALCPFIRHSAHPYSLNTLSVRNNNKFELNNACTVCGSYNGYSTLNWPCIYIYIYILFTQIKHLFFLSVSVCLSVMNFFVK